MAGSAIVELVDAAGKGACGICIHEWVGVSAGLEECFPKCGDYVGWGFCGWTNQRDAAGLGTCRGIICDGMPSVSSARLCGRGLSPDALQWGQYSLLCGV